MYFLHLSPNMFTRDTQNPHFHCTALAMQNVRYVTVDRSDNVVKLRDLITADNVTQYVTLSGHVTCMHVT